MTLTPYEPPMLDQFALRLLDVAATIRLMAQRAREQDVEDVPLHDKKASEWIARLERWARRAAADLEMRVIDARARRRAASRRR